MSNILMISYHTCPLASIEGKETGGMNVYVLELAKALGAAGHTVDMVTRAQASDNARQVEVAPGVRLFHLPAGPLEVLSKKEMFQHIDAFTEEVWKLLGELQVTYNVVHAHYYMSGLVALGLKERGLSQPIAMTFHTLALMKNLVGRSEGEKEDFARIEAEEKLVHAVDRIISPTTTEQDYLNYLYAADVNKIAIVSPGVNTEYFKDTPKDAAKSAINASPEDKVLLFVGRIEPLKGIDTLLYAVKILSVRRPEIKLCLRIVGGDVSQPVAVWTGELQRLEQLRRALKLETAVTFEGQQPQEKLPDYYNAAELLIMPSHYEAFGMVALEAMACGTPVITSNVTGVSTILDDEHEEIITTANNPLLLASQIEYLLTHPDKYQEIQNSLLEKAAEFSWTHIARQIVDVYQTTATQ